MRAQTPNIADTHRRPSVTPFWPCSRRPTFQTQYWKTSIFVPSSVLDQYFSTGTDLWLQSVFVSIFVKNISISSKNQYFFKISVIFQWYQVLIQIIGKSVWACLVFVASSWTCSLYCKKAGHSMNPLVQGQIG